MGPLDADRPWRTNDIVGVYRFLQRLWRSIVDEQTGGLPVADLPLDEDTQRSCTDDQGGPRGLRRAAVQHGDRAADGAGQPRHAVAAGTGPLPRALAEPLVLMVAPLAPHIAEELWPRLGHPQSLAYEPFPEADEALAAEPTVVVPVQVNGKTRFRIEVPADADEEEIRDRWPGIRITPVTPTA